MRREDAVMNDDGVAWGRLIDEERGCCDEEEDGVVKDEVGVISVMSVM